MKTGCGTSLNYMLLLFFGLVNINNSFDIRLKRRTIKENIFKTDEEVYMPFVFELSLGTPLQIFDCTIDTNNYALWLPSIEIKEYFLKTFQGINSSTYSMIDSSKLISIESYDGLISGHKVIDKIYNSNSESYLKEDFHWLLIEFGLFEYFSADGSVGFARKYPDNLYELPNSNSGKGESYSFIDLLYKEKAITNKVFSITRKNYNKEGILSIGDYDQKLFDDNKKGKCYAAKDSDSFYLKDIDDLWNCKINEIQLDDITLKLSDTSKENIMIFATSTEFIYAPMENGLRLFENITALIGKSIVCKKKSDQNAYQLQCENFDYESNNMTLSFILDGGYKLTASSKDLWKKLDKDHLLFNVIALGQINYWKVGEPMLKYEHMLFNYDDGSVTMIKYSYSLLILYFIIGGICLLILITIIIIVSVFICKKCKRSPRKTTETNTIDELAKESLINPKDI